MKKSHSLSKRQIQQYVGSADHIPADRRPILDAVNEAYHEFDADRLEMEKLLATFSTQFISATMENIDYAINDALRMIGALAGVDRCYIFQFTAGGLHISNTHEWCAEEIESPISRLQNVSVEDYRWLLASIENGTPVCVPRTADLPPEAAALKKELEMEKVQSMICFPLASGGKMIGWLGCNSVRQEKNWDEDIIVLLNIIGNIFASALERKRSEKALQRSEDLLRQSQKMEAIGRLTGGIAHDFNNMITSIVGFAQLVLNQNPHEIIRADVEEILNSGYRAAQLTSQLLAFSRKQIRQIRRIDLNQVVMDMERLLARTLGENINLITELGENLGAIEADIGQIEQVIMNLTLNARDAMPEGGDLTIRTEKITIDAKDKRLSMGLKPGVYTQLVIADKGSGIPSEIRAHAFEPFFTTKPEGKGTGLGLATVYTIAREYGGGADLVNIPEGGAEARVYLPCTDAPPDALPERLEPQLQGGQETILLVEDEDAVRRLAMRILLSLGYRVLEARNGNEALDIDQQHEGSIHLLLTDVVMPKMGGVALSDILRKKHQGLKVLYTTGFSESTAFSPSDNHRERTIVFKPYSEEILAQRIREVLDT